MSSLSHGAALVAIFAACGGATPREARCGPNGHPPARTRPGTRLIADSPAPCPSAKPLDGAACSLPIEPATDSFGKPSESFATCNYAAPDRGPCEWDACTCERRGAAGPATWTCGRAFE